MPQGTFTFDQALALGIQFHHKGELDQAEQIYLQILQVAPNHVSVLHNLGEVACRRRRFDVALQYLQRAIALEPNNPNNMNTLAVALMSLGRADEAFELCRRTVIVKPDFSNAHSNLGICHVDRGEPGAAIAEFRRAIELDPTNACAHDGLGLTLLMTGQLQQGWKEQEWRWRKFDFAPSRYPNAPHWRGQPLAGRTLMLYVEQGYGDVIQFCRYVPLLAARGARVIMEDVSELGLLLRRSLQGLAGVFRSGQPPAFDLCCPLMSVPLWYGTELNTIPAPTSYIMPDAALVEKYREIFQADQTFKVGIVWAGRPTHANDHNRSTPLSTFAPLAQVPGVTFYSLQKGPRAIEAAQPPPGMNLIDLSPRLNNFEDTAAIIQHLDLVIGVDTVLIHLAASMGKPVWALIPFCPDWRWLLSRKDSPWYPTLRLFRLPSRGDWKTAITNITTALQSTAARPQT